MCTAFFWMMAFCKLIYCLISKTFFPEAAIHACLLSHDFLIKQQSLLVPVFSTLEPFSYFN